MFNDEKSGQKGKKKRLLMEKFAVYFLFVTYINWRYARISFEKNDGIIKILLLYRHKKRLHIIKEL